jgi:type VI protein secretion system component Hcp
MRLSFKFSSQIAQAHEEKKMPKAKKSAKRSKKLTTGKKSEAVKPLTTFNDLHVTKPVDVPSPKLF